jgi:rubredoxin---NAD+ reductase
MTDPIVIIGSGLAGYSLAREFRKLNKEQPLLIITQDDGTSYSKPMLSTGFTKNKTAKDLEMADPVKMSEQLDISIRTRSSVTNINAANKTVCVDSEQISYSKLVLATGAVVNHLSFPGSDLGRVVSINDLDDYRHFRALADGKKRVLIMGAGLIGCEYANDLLNGGYEVEIVDPSSAVLGQLIPAETGRCVAQGLSDAGAKIHLGSYVSSISESNDELSVTLNTGEVCLVDVVISAIGLRPNVAIAQDAGLEIGLGIKCDRFLTSSHQDIYAIGDCAEIDGHVLLYVLPLMSGARALAQTLNDNPTPVHYGVMPVAIKTPACPVIVSPPPKGAAGDWEVESEGLNSKALFYGRDKTLLGFALSGDFVSEKQTLTKQIKGIHDA